jgi:hypothetical protein
MRKSIFIIATLFATTFASAQITYEGFFKGILTTQQNPWTVDFLGERSPVLNPSVPFVIGIADGITNDTIFLYNKSDFSLYRTISFNENISAAFCFAKGVYFEDEKIGFIVELSDGYWICDEDGNKIYSINQNIQKNNIQIVSEEIIELENSIKLLLWSKDRGTYIFTLPGNGEAQAVNTPSSPKRNARKIARDGQVLVQTDNYTYTLTGAEVK